jgi:hypothetical protein
MSEVGRSMRRVTGIRHSHQNSRFGVEQVSGGVVEARLE